MTVTRSFFLRAAHAALTIGVCLPLCSVAADGIAIGLSYRSSVAMTNISEGAKTGKIVKYVIRNDTVAQCDTIYKATWVRKAVLSPDGSRVAFLRLDAKTVGGQYQPGNGNRYISVMDIDGRNVRDIATFANSGGSDLGRITIDWPAGDWIYYVSPSVTNGWSVCKVAVADSSSKRCLFTYGKFRFGTWSISIDQSKAVIVSGMCNYTLNGTTQDWCIMPHTFPPSSEPTRDGFTTDCYSGCMATMLAGGNYYSHFYSGTHDKFMVNSWAPPSQCLSAITVTCVDIATMLKTTVQNTGDILDGLLGSTNSDKWVCVEGFRFRYGTIHMLVNWVDKKAIKLSGHSMVAAVSDTAIQRCEIPGDFRVSGGPAGCYQTAQGTWAPIPGFVNSGAPLHQRDMAAVHASLRRMLVTDRSGRMGVVIAPASRPTKGAVFDIAGKARNP
jgi:hypothetical protein